MRISLSRRWRESALVRNTLWVTLGQGGRVVIQAAYFVLIARALGATGYGAFVAAFAVSTLLAPFATLGSGHVLIREAARDPRRFAHYWGGAMTVTLVLGVGASLLVAMLGRVALPATVPWTLIACVAAADFGCAAVLQLCSQAYQARERMGRTAQLALVTSALRLVAAVVFVFGARGRTPASWGVYYLACSVLSAAVSIGFAARELGRPRLAWTLTWRELREGCYFAAGTASQTVYNDIDKTMLSRIAPTLSATGIYGAAYRLIDVALVPIRSVGQAAYPKFFRHGAAGVRSSLGVAKRLLPAVVGYATAAALILVATASLLPLALGKDFTTAAEALRWLAPLLVLKAIQYGAADTLTGAGRQGTRTVVQVVVALVNIAINIPLITMYSWRGAAWASLASDGLLAVLLWIAVWQRARAESLSGAGLAMESTSSALSAT